MFAGALAGAVVAGIGDGCSCVAEEGALQRWVPDAVLGRAAASYDALLAVASIVGLGLAGAVVAAAGARGAYVLAAMVCGLAAAVVGGRALLAAAPRRRVAAVSPAA